MFKHIYLFLLLTVFLLLFSSFSFAEPEGLLNVKVGVYENPPKVYTNSSGKVAGIFPDILEVIAAKEGWHLEYVHGTWEQGLERLSEGEIDVMVDIAFSKERAKRMSFAKESIFLNWGSLYTGKDLVAESLLDLKGKTVATVKGDIHTVGENGILKLDEKFELGLNFVFTDSYMEVMQLTQAGEVDAGVVNRLFGIISEEEYSVNRSPVVFNSVRLKYAFSREAAERGLLQRVDDQVKRLKLEPESAFHDIVSSYLAGVEYDLEAYSELKPLQFSVQELDWLQSGHVIRVGVDPDYAPYSYKDKKGSYQGLAVDILQLAARRLGLNVEIQKNLSWQQVMGKAKSGELDLILTAVETDSRLDFLRFTDVYLPTPLVIITREDDYSIEGPEDIEDSRVALVSDYSATDRLTRELQEITPVMVDTPLAGLAAVSAGEADCFVGVLGVVDFLLRDGGISNLKVSGRYDMLCNGQSFAVRKDWPLLQSVLNKAIDAISEQKIIELHNRWISSLSLLDGPAALQEENVLTEAETEWVRGHQHIVLGVDPEFAPFEFFDQNGKYQGITADYIKILNRRLGLQMTPLTGLSWNEVIDRAKKWEIDVLPIVGKTRERLEYLNFTQPYMDFHRVMITRSDMPFISSVGDIAHQKIAVQQNSSHYGFIKEMTSIEATEYPTLVAGLKAVSEGKEDAFVGNLASAMYWIRKVGLTNLKVAGPASYDCEQLYFSIRKDWPELASIIEKGLASISSAKAKEIRERWISVEYEPGISVKEVLKYFLPAGFIGILVLTLIVTANKRLKKEIDEKQKAQKDLTDKLLGEKLLSRIASSFIHIEDRDIPELFLSILGDVGQLLEADTAHVLTVSEDRKWGEIIFSWTSDSGQVVEHTPAEPLSLKHLELDGAVQTFAASIHRQEDGQDLIVNSDSDQLPRFFTSPVNIAVPIFRGGSLYALCWFSSDDKNIGWQEDDTTFLDTVGYIIGNSLDKIDIDRELQEHRDLLEVRIARRTEALERSNRQLVKEMTDREEAELEKEKLQRQLFQTQKMESIGTLAGGIAHEFNNILTVILGNTEVTRSLCQPDSPIRQNLDRIMEAGGRAKKLVLQILTFSRESTAEPVSIDPAKVVAESMLMLRPTLPSTIEIQEEYKVFGSHIYADPNQIDQIILNLCTNAFHAMEENGGTLSVMVEMTELDRADLAQQVTVEPGDYVKISVCDSGFGIAGDAMDKIFDPFYTTKKVGKGTGLGLPVVHGIVKKAGGFIEVESKEGEGSIFRLFFPSHPATNMVVKDSSEPTFQGNERILLVDDEEIIAEVNKNLIETMGYEVTVSHGSVEAIKLFENNPSDFDLVLTDQSMPDISGIDLAKNLLNLRPDLPVILCTGYSSLIEQEKAEKIGVRGFILKPFGRKEIGEMIRKLCDT